MTTVDPTRAAIEMDEMERLLLNQVLGTMDLEDVMEAVPDLALVINRANKINLVRVYLAGQSGRVRGPWASTVQLLAIRAANAERKLAAMTSPGEGAPSPTSLPEAEPSPGDPSTPDPTGAS